MSLKFISFYVSKFLYIFIDKVIYAKGKVWIHHAVKIEETDIKGQFCKSRDNVLPVDAVIHDNIPPADGLNVWSSEPRHCQCH